MIRLRPAKTVMDDVASREKDVRKDASSERSELHIALQHRAVDENRMVEYAHPAAEFRGIQIDEFAMLKTASVKTLVRKVDVFERDSRSVQPDDFLVLVYVVENIFPRLFRVRQMFEAKIFSLGNFAVIVENRESHFFASFFLAFVLLEHNLHCKRLNEICQMFTIKICAGNAEKKSTFPKAFFGNRRARNAARICIAAADADSIRREAIMIAAKLWKILWRKKRARIFASIFRQEKIPHGKTIPKPAREKAVLRAPRSTRFFHERIFANEKKSLKLNAKFCTRKKIGTKRANI